MPMPRYANPIALPRFAVEPPRQQHLVRQRSGAHVAERVEKVEGVERGQRGCMSEPDERCTRHQDSREQQPPRTESIHEPAGGESEDRADDELAERVAGRDLLARPAVVRHEEVVEEREAVQSDADDREQREERRRGDVDLPPASRVVGASGRVRASPARRAASPPRLGLEALECRRRRVLEIERIERVAARHEAVSSGPWCSR